MAVKSDRNETIVDNKIKQIVSTLKAECKLKHHKAGDANTTVIVKNTAREEVEGVRTLVSVARAKFRVTLPTEIGIASLHFT